MDNTKTQQYQDLLRKALGRKSNNTKARKLDVKKNYASFWMDDLGKGNDRFGLGSDFSGKNSDIVKAVKLNSYRKAIANFVKILTNKEIPVKFSGTESYTDGHSVTISADIKDNNFDVSVGLALHEASHILLTDFDVLPALRDGKIEAAKHLDTALVKDMLNFIEDRRIDHYVFSTSPGYKAYYHKLYEHYWNTNDLIKGLLSPEFRNPAEIDSWMFQIINMMNPAFDATVMPRLQEIVDLIDIPNIKRLKSTQEALDIAIQVTQIITDELNAAQAQVEQKQKQQQGQSGEQGEQGEEGEEGTESNDGSESKDSTESNDGSESKALSGEGSEGGEDSGDEDGEGESGEGDGSEPANSLTASERRAVESTLREQRKFMDGQSNKKRAGNSLANKLDKVDKEGVTIEQVGGKYTCLNYDVTGKEFIAAADAKEKLSEARNNVYKASYGTPEKQAAEAALAEIRKASELLSGNYFSSPSTNYAQAVDKGMLMGQLLGKKLQMRNESRERIDNRLRSGKIDNRRLAAAGYGIESVFHQITVDKYKKANLHMSLDGSGSMGGANWENTAMMAAAIAKALTYTSNVEMQISIRVTSDGSIPANYFIYDSRKNTLRELQVILKAFSPNGMTPEGLCFESMIKKNQLVKASGDMDSYFVNLSDGGPGGVGSYYGDIATTHTRAQVTKMRNDLGMGVLSYFMTQYGGSDFASSGSGRMFQAMYGKAATNIAPDNVMEIAKTLNNLFMNKA
jgi:uncharacterized protein with von Willebrand factor type A (vWA) domain